MFVNQPNNVIAEHAWQVTIGYEWYASINGGCECLVVRTPRQIIGLMPRCSPIVNGSWLYADGKNMLESGGFYTAEHLTTLMKVIAKMDQVPHLF